MNSYCCSIFLILLLSNLSISSGGTKKIMPNLTLRDTMGSSFTPVPQQEDLSSYTILLNFLKDTTEICSVGVWAFYPDKNFLINGTDGFIVGEDEKLKCFQITEAEKTALLSMQSYRHLGPSDLSVKSITLYSQAHFAGAQFIVFESDQPVLDIPNTILNVSSYIITAPTDDLPEENGSDELRTVVKIFSSLDATATEPRTCLALINPVPAPVVPAKMFLRSELTALDYFGSLEFHPYTPDITVAPGVCTVPQVNFVPLP